MNELIDTNVIDSALQNPIADFEDAVLHHTALTVGADCIVTRNEADFKRSELIIYSPTQSLAAIAD